MFPLKLHAHANFIPVFPIGPFHLWLNHVEVVIPTGTQSYESLETLKWFTFGHRRYLPALNAAASRQNMREPSSFAAWHCGQSFLCSSSRISRSNAVRRITAPFSKRYAKSSWPRHWSTSIRNSLVLCSVS